jgi:hypothetical protein
MRDRHVWTARLNRALVAVSALSLVAVLFALLRFAP